MQPLVQFGASTTAEQVGEKYAIECEGKTVIVTGGNTGLGLETCRVLSGKGAVVVLASRSQKNGDAAVEKIKKDFPNAKVEVMLLDLGLLKSVKKFATLFESKHKRLDILICNAGIMAVPRALTADGLESQFGVNHVGHQYLCQLLLPLLLKTASAQNPARILTLSSLGNFMFAPDQGIDFDDILGEKSYNPWVRYGQSKLANILMAKELHRQHHHKNLICVALHPGAIVSTELARSINITAGLQCLWGILSRSGAFSRVLFGERNKSIKEGSSTTLLCALSPEIKSGEYYFDCTLCDSSTSSNNLHPKASDGELAKKLWTFTEALIAEKSK